MSSLAECAHCGEHVAFRQDRLPPLRGIACHSCGGQGSLMRFVDPPRGYGRTCKHCGRGLHSFEAQDVFLHGWCLKCGKAAHVVPSSYQLG